MKRNWYAIYTKPNCEKKVADLLSKKEIKNYYPLNRIVDFRANRKKAVYEPLISTLVFVYITEGEITIIKKTNNVINFVYWLGQPAVIKHEEIVNMQSFITEYSNIKLEKTTVSPQDQPLTADSAVPEEPNLVSVENSCIRLMLPSLGYMMIAEVDESYINVFDYNGERNKLVS